MNSVRAAMLFAVLSLLPATAHAQGAIEAWVQRYNGPGNGDDYPSAMVVDVSGNVYVTGVSYGADPAYGGSEDDYATIAYSSAGVPLWTNLYNGPGNGTDQAGGVALDATGNLFVTGGSQASGSAYYVVATIKYSSAGVPLWTNLYSAPGYDASYGQFIAVDATGNVVVVGGASLIGGTCLTIKYSSAGALLWARTYSYGSGWASALALDPSGNVVVTGCLRGGAGFEDYLTIKYSSAGALLWTRLYNGPVGSGQDRANALAVDGDGNVIVTGRSDGTNSYQDCLTIKYSSAGMPLWTNRYDGPVSGSDEGNAVAVDAGGNVYVTGYSEAGGGPTDYLTIKYSSAGVPLWTNCGPAGSPGFMALDSSGNVFVTGWSTGSGTGEDIATVAYSSAGVPLWTNRYEGPGNGGASGQAVAVDASGNVYVTGRSSFGIASVGGQDWATVKYVIPPIIARQPLSCTNAIGTTASFIVEAAGGVPLSYQWRRQGTNLVDGGNLSGATTTNLLIANVQLADAGGYTVVVTNAYGSATSIVAQLTVTIPPSPGRFTHLSYSPETGLSFIFRDATPGQPYRIQTSPSLAEGSWVDWQSFTYNGPIDLTDLGALDVERRYYRVVSP